MRYMRIFFVILAFPLLIVADTSALRLAEGTKPDWRGENGLVFAADSATLAFEGDGAGAVATVRRAPDAPPRPVVLAPDPAQDGRWLLQLPELGWYEIEIAGRDGPALLSLTAAVIGAPIPEAWRTNSVFGIWNVHGDPALIRLAGARWNRRMTSFRDVTQDDVAKYGDITMQNAECRMQNAENSSLVTRHSSLAEDERDGLRQVGVFSFGMPLWTMDMPKGIKLPSFGNPFYPAKDWDDVARAVAAYARTHALPRDFSIYNEPLAHFKGKPAQIADYARAVRKGLKAADPSFRIGGPGLYSIRIRDLTAIEEGGLLESLDFLDLHAYVGGTPPEGEFIRKIEMLKEWLAAHGHPDMPIYLTEFGWTAAAGTWQPSVDRATQARYVARSLALAWSQGVKALVYFALEYRTKKEGEAAFSLIGPGGRPEAGYCAFAAVSRHFAASEPIGHFILAPGVHMAAGRRDGRLQLMVWSEDGAPLPSLSLPWEIESRCNLYGTRCTDKSDLLFLETERMGLQSLHFALCDGRTVETTSLPKRNEASIFGGFFCVPDGDDLPDGDYAAFVLCSTGGYAVRTYRLHSPATISDARLVWPASSAMPVLEADIASHETNRLAVALSLDGGEAQSLALAPNKSQTACFPLANAVPGELRRSTLRLQLPDGATRERAVDWIALAIWPKIAAAAPWATSESWEKFGDAGGDAPAPRDCAARARLSHDSAALTVEVEVTDDEHAQDAADPSRLWASDSIQLGFDMDWGKPWEAGFAGAETSQTLGGHRVFEFSIGGKGDGPGIAYLERSWDDALPAGTVRPAIKAQIVRDEVAARTRYIVRIPWAELGAAARPPHPSEAIGFSLAVNDIDPKSGATRHGVTLFGGIVDEKEPKLFGPAWLR